MKSLVTTILLFAVSIVYGQDIAPEGSYAIEHNKKQEKLSLSEETRVLIDSRRDSDKDITIKVGEFNIRIMSENKLNQGIRWSKYILVPEEK